MLFLKLFALAYLIASVLAIAMVFAAVQDRLLRAVFIVLGLAMPVIALYALVASIVSPQGVPRFQEEIAKVEDDIETERIRIFGGERICPSFGMRWEKMYELYLERLALQAVHASERIVSFAGTFKAAS